MVRMVRVISSKFGHQRAPLALVPSWRGNSSYGVNTLGPLCLWQCLALSISIQFVSSSAKVTSVKFHKTSLTQLERTRYINGTRESDKKEKRKCKNG